jgi:protoporphyrinogen/coproporphyrinogen III oxidase
VSRDSARHVVIVGGGIAGLAAAWRLQQLARASCDPLRITLIEASDRFGGKLQTEQVDGLTVEAGPDSFLSYKPAAIALAKELGIEDRIIGTRETGGGTYILRDGQLEPLPEGITMMVPTKLKPLLRSRLLSTRAKLRMAAEYLIPPRTDDADESIGAFISRRLGREAFDRMAQPLLSGIFAGDADQLSLAATFPRLRDIERKHGSLVKGMLAQRKQAASGAGRSSNGKPAYPPFVSFAGGMAELANAVVEALEQVDLRSGTPVDAVIPAESTYQVKLSNGKALDADAVLLATPAYVTADLLYHIDGELAALLRRIPYVSTATINLAFRRSDIDTLQAGRGFVIPHVENRELTAVTWASNKFEGRAPDDLALLRTFVGRAGREDAVDLDDDALLRLARSELRAILGITAEQVTARVYRWRRAMPQYVLGHLERLEQIDQLLERHPGISLLGAGYRGVGIPDCIESGNRAADRAVSHLSTIAVLT